MVRGEERMDIKAMFRAGVSISEIHRRTGRDRKTIRRIVREPDAAASSRVARPRRPSKLDPYKGYILKRMAEGVLNAVRIFREIRAMGYTGGLTILRDFMRPHRPAVRSKVTVRYETEPGRQGQVDVGNFGYVDPQGTVRRLSLVTFTLSFSRMLYAEFVRSENQLELLGAMRRAFEYLGGVPHEVLSDNTSSLVVRPASAGRPTEWRPEYLDLAAHYGFVPRACQPGRARTKGKVERPIGYIRRSFWPVEFTDLEDLNRKLRDWLDNVANVRIHATTGEQPVTRWRKERLLPLNPKPFVMARVEPRKVTHDCLVSWDGSKYSVPWTLAGREVVVRELESGELLVEHEGRVVARHRVLPSRGRALDPVHYQGVPLTGVDRPGRALGRQVPCQVQTRPLELYDHVVGVTHND